MISISSWIQLLFFCLFFVVFFVCFFFFFGGGGGGGGVRVDVNEEVFVKMQNKK